VIGIDPSTNQFAYLNFDGTIVDFTLNDASAANHLTNTTRGFWAEWFVEASDQIRFIEHLLHRFDFNTSGMKERIPGSRSTQGVFARICFTSVSASADVTVRSAMHPVSSALASRSCVASFSASSAK